MLIEDIENDETTKVRAPIEPLIREMQTPLVAAVDDEETPVVHSAGSKRSRRSANKRKKTVLINLENCKYDIVRHCCNLMNFKIAGENITPDAWHLHWLDTGVSMERVLAMKPYQKINHFPGMSEICRKDNLARNLNRISKLFPEEYDFFPKTWILPIDYADFQMSCKSGGGKKSRVYIAKPDSGCQGKGIYLFKDSGNVPPTANMIVQRYLNKPLLIDGFKFDLRIYVLMSSCDPLRLFVYREGLARFATEPYAEPSVHNFHNVCMHLTNYAVNKHNDKFERDDQAGEHSGSKRTMSSIFRLLKQRGHDVDTLWSRIQDVLIKTILTAQPKLQQIHRACSTRFRAMTNDTSSCFEVLGFDVFIDSKLKPWVLEVNHSPSFTCDAEVDFRVKEALISDTLRLVRINGGDQRRVDRVEKQRVRRRLFRASSDSGVNSRRQIEDMEDLLSGAPTKEQQSTVAANTAEEKRTAWLTAYEDRHMGHFERLYPATNVKRQSQYLIILGETARLESETYSSKMRKAYVAHQAAQNQDKSVPPVSSSVAIRTAPPARGRQLEEESGSNGSLSKNERQTRSAVTTQPITQTQVLLAAATEARQTHTQRVTRRSVSLPRRAKLTPLSSARPVPLLESSVTGTQHPDGVKTNEPTVVHQKEMYPPPLWRPISGATDILSRRKTLALSRSATRLEEATNDHLSVMALSAALPRIDSWPKSILGEPRANQRTPAVVQAANNQSISNPTLSVSVASKTSRSSHHFTIMTKHGECNYSVQERPVDTAALASATAQNYQEQRQQRLLSVPSTERPSSTSLSMISPPVAVDVWSSAVLARRKDK